MASTKIENKSNLELRHRGSSVPRLLQVLLVEVRQLLVFNQLILGLELSLAQETGQSVPVRIEGLGVEGSQRETDRRGTKRLGGTQL